MLMHAFLYVQKESLKVHNSQFWWIPHRLPRILVGHSQIGLFCGFRIKFWQIPHKLSEILVGTKKIGQNFSGSMHIR